MRILSVIPSENGMSATIHTVKDGQYLNYVYSEVYELLHDPIKYGEWCAWNGGTLTDAISYVISLPGSVNDNFSISIDRS
jgi:hypothetical protein